MTRLEKPNTAQLLAKYHLKDVNVVEAAKESNKRKVKCPKPLFTSSPILVNPLGSITSTARFSDREIAETHRSGTAGHDVKPEYF